MAQMIDSQGFRENQAQPAGSQCHKLQSFLVAINFEDLKGLV